MELSLSPEELRVLGVLIEKQRATPEYYPMTLNAIVAACNQKTSRDPVVSYGLAQVMRILDSLHKKRLVGTATADSARVSRYWHALEGALQLSDAEVAVLCCLMLRGPQTPGELRARTTRLFEFEDVGHIESVLAGLSQRTPSPLVVSLGRRAGQKEDRYAHLLGDQPPETPGEDDLPDAEVSTSAEERLQALEERLAALERAFSDFRSQFE